MYISPSTRRNPETCSGLQSRRSWRSTIVQSSEVKRSLRRERERLARVRLSALNAR